MTMLFAVLLLCWLPSAAAPDGSSEPVAAAMTASRVHPTSYARRAVLKACIDQIYSPSSPGFVWFTAAGPRAAVGAALQSLRSSGARGLAPEDYDIGALERAIDALGDSKRQPEDFERADRAMTVTMLRFLSDLRFGRVRPEQVEPHYRAQPRDANFVARLRDAVAQDQLESLADSAEPVFPIYGRLKRLLVRYRQLAALPAITLPPLAPHGTIAPSGRYAGAAELRELLLRLGDLDAGAPPAPETYTEDLARGIRRFQARHGLEADGILGRNTLAALNVPVAARLSHLGFGMVHSLARSRVLSALHAAL
jgi:murein L,D-transpeptidase YcbB/YkuD